VCVRVMIQISVYSQVRSGRVFSLSVAKTHSCRLNWYRGYSKLRTHTTPRVIIYS